MVSRYFIRLGYDGARYHGWQIQPNGLSVQEVLQQSLSVLLRTPTPITGAGRTDSGVNARLMVAHFDFDGPLDWHQLAYRLNRMVPQDIVIRSIEPVNMAMHARFSAVSRTYHYYLHQGKEPFLSQYSMACPYTLDFKLMNEAAQMLLGTKDFGAFCKAGTDVKTTLCTLTEAHWDSIENAFGVGQRCFTITANRFLRNMVRAIVGTLIEVGRGRMSLEEFAKVIASGSRTAAGESVPGHALFLWDIQY